MTPEALMNNLSKTDSTTLFILLVVLTSCVFANIRYYLTLQRAMSTINPALRPLPAASIWLALLPFVGVLWYMIYAVALSRGLGKELARRQIPGDGSIRVAVTTVILLGLCLVPHVSLLVAIPAVVMWMIHWVRMSAYYKLLSEPVYMMVE